MHYHRPRDLLATGCCLWGLFTWLASCSGSYALHFLLRLLIGAALAASQIHFGDVESLYSIAFDLQMQRKFMLRNSFH